MGFGLCRHPRRRTDTVPDRWVDADTAALLINTGPILITVLAAIFLNEGFPPRLFAGCAVAFAACVLIGLTGSRAGSGRGLALLILAALAYATAVIIQKPALARASPLAVTWLGCASATLVCLPSAPTLVHELGQAGPTAIAWTGYLGLGPTALGFATWASALRHSNAGRVAALTYLIPVIAILLSWMLLSQNPPSQSPAAGSASPASPSPGGDDPSTVGAPPRELSVFSRRRQPNAVGGDKRTTGSAAAGAVVPI